jgi:S-adenosylmethionine hydrolase
MSIITLTTDFGHDDPYVAVMKGVILGINPSVDIIDICHTIKPQNIAQAAYILNTSSRYFPKGTIHVVVVDPGVGTERRALLVVSPEAIFLGPDNGVLSYVMEEAQPEVEVIALTNTRFWLTPLSNTFHGRDVFAPVAAHLSLGTSPGEFGEAIQSLSLTPVSRPLMGEDGVLIGHVIYVDWFGNLITDIRQADLPEGRLFVEIGGHIIDDLSQTYDEGEELLAIMGSDNRLEVSVKKGSAAGFLRAGVGDEVKVGINKTSLKGRLRP